MIIIIIIMINLLLFIYIYHINKYYRQKMKKIYIYIITTRLHFCNRLLQDCTFVIDRVLWKLITS